MPCDGLHPLPGRALQGNVPRGIDFSVLETAHLLGAFLLKGQELEVYLHVLTWNLLLITLGMQFPHVGASGQSVEAVASENEVCAGVGNFYPVIARQIPNDPDGPQVILAAQMQNLLYDLWRHLIGWVLRN